MQKGFLPNRKMQAVILLFVAALIMAGALMTPQILCARETGDKKTEVRPVSDFRIVLPYGDAARIFENNKMVVIEADELDRLIEKNNRMIRERYNTDGPQEKKPPADYIVSSVSYKFIKDRDTVLCSADIDISVLVDKKFVLIPLFSGEMAMTDAVIDDTVPVMLVETPDADNDKQQQVENQAIQQQMVRQSINAPNVSHGFPRPDKGTSNRYSILVKGKGRHDLNIRFLLTPQKDGANSSFEMAVPYSPKNFALFLHDERDSVIKFFPSVGLRSFTHPDTRNQAAEADFGFTDKLKVTFFSISSEEKRMIEEARKAELGAADSIEAAVIDNPDTNETAAAGSGSPVKPAEEAEEAPLVSCDVNSIFSVGDGAAKGSHELNFRIIRGKVSKVAVLIPAGTEIEDVAYPNYDKRQISEYTGYSSVEIFFRSPESNDFSMTLASNTKLDDGKYEISLPEVEVSGVESERGHIAVCAATNIKISLAGEPGNLERIDAFELPAGIKYSIVSPILFAFKYFKHPYRARLSLTKYSDSAVLSTVFPQAVINTVITSQEKAISSCDLEVRNNGMPHLKMMATDKLEVLYSSVANRVVKASLDSESNLMVPVQKSTVSGDSVSSFPVNIKAASPVTKLAGPYGSMTVSLPRVEFPVMHLKWRVYTPEDFVFFNYAASPSMNMPENPPLVYKIAVNSANGVFNFLDSPHALDALFTLLFVSFLVFAFYLAYIGGEKVFNSNLAANFVAGAKNLIVTVYVFLTGSWAVVVVLFVILFLFVAAVSTPNFNRSRAQSKDKACVSNMKMIEGAAELYLMEKGGASSITTHQLLAGGYLKGNPVCPGGGGYTIYAPTRGANGATEIYCPVHGWLSRQDNYSSRFVTPSSIADSGNAAGNLKRQEAPGAVSGISVDDHFRNEESVSMSDGIESDSKVIFGKASSEMKKEMAAPVPASSPKARPVKQFYKAKKSDGMIVRTSSSASDQGIFSVPIKFPVTSKSEVFERLYVAPGETVRVNLSYISSSMFNLVLALMVVLGLAFPYLIARSLSGGPFIIIAVPALIAVIVAMEAGNAYLPQTARFSQIGLLGGILIFLLMKIAAFLMNPETTKWIVAAFSAPRPDVPASPAVPAQAPSAPIQTSAGPGSPVQPSQAPKSGNEGGPSDKPPLPPSTLSIILFTITFCASLVFAPPALAGPGSIEIPPAPYLNPATAEISVFQLMNYIDSAAGPGKRFVMIPYPELRRLIDAVNSMQYSSVTEPLIELPPYNAVVKKVVIRGSVTTELAVLDIDFFVEVFGNEFTSVDLFSGNLAVSRIESFLIKPYNFGFYGISDAQIDKLNRAYSSKRDQDRLAQYRSGKAFEKVTEYNNFRMSPGREKYAALFEDSGEYLVKATVKTDVTSRDNSFRFDLAMHRAPCVKISLSTPREYDVIADNLIVESQAFDTKSNEIRTQGSLVPADSYSFRLTLAEEFRRAREKRRRDEEEKARQQRLKQLGERLKTDEVRVITKKLEPRVNVSEARLLTVDSERFVTSSEFGFNIQNTELAEIRFDVPPGILITRVDSEGMRSWKPPSESTDKHVDTAGKLVISYRTPRQGRVTVSISYEQRTPSKSEAPVNAAWIVPSGHDEYKGYMGVNSAINAEVAATCENNLVAVDESELPSDTPKRTTPVLFAYKVKKLPAGIALAVKKRTDIPSIPCVVDVASFRTYLNREGTVITRAEFRIRNNNVQFLELRLPAGSEVWCLKVGGKLVKPGKGPEGKVFLPLLKSPLVNSDFMAFSVELVYAGAVGTALSDFGKARLELPRIGAICSRVDWEIGFGNEYNFADVACNMRRVKVLSSDAGDGNALNQSVSMDKMMDIQMDQLRGASNIMNTQTAVNEPVRAAGSAASFGTTTRGQLPVTVEVPKGFNPIYMTGEILKRDDGDQSAFFAEITYFSKPAINFSAYLIFFAGAALFVYFIRVLFISKKYIKFLFLAVLTGLLAAALERLAGNGMIQLYHGVALGILVILMLKIVKISDKEREILKLK